MGRGYHHEDAHYSGYCRECGKYVAATVTIDVGIGPYEFWGDRGVHHDYREACPYCDNDAVDEMAGQPCHVCGNYDEEGMICKIALQEGGFHGPEELDTGDECRFWTGKEAI